jgi:primosomal protein N' (replication factor Y)
VGSERTAEELGRAFPGIPVIGSSGEAVRHQVSAEPALVVATPGAEPVATDGYAAALLLDSWALVGRADVRAAEETVRRWMSAAALVRARVYGGEVLVVADSSLRPVQALIQWAPDRFAAAELAERSAAGLPPARRFAAVRGESEVVTATLNDLQLPPDSQVIGPIAVGQPSTTVDAASSNVAADVVQALISVRPGVGGALVAQLRAVQGQRCARKLPMATVRVDPLRLE